MVAISSIILLILLLGMNILICYIYQKNFVFPILFMLFEILIIPQIDFSGPTEILFMVFFLVFSVIYNLMNEIWFLNENKKR